MGNCVCCKVCEDDAKAEASPSEREPLLSDRDQRENSRGKQPDVKTAAGTSTSPYQSAAERHGKLKSAVTGTEGLLAHAKQLASTTKQFTSESDKEGTKQKQSYLRKLKTKKRKIPSYAHDNDDSTDDDEGSSNEMQPSTEQIIGTNVQEFSKQKLGIWKKMKRKLYKKDEEDSDIENTSAPETSQQSVGESSKRTKGRLRLWNKKKKKRKKQNKDGENSTAHATGVSNTDTSHAAQDLNEPSQLFAEMKTTEDDYEDRLEQAQTDVAELLLNTKQIAKKLEKWS
ncbi:uncharacterized protein LOC102806533 [Saccoglossus kowalevskii]|uniref:Uncharacterized protein DDB_G0286299-like n=1 Tax=Saccoglossus kowalevskii TaxID=10224 RepID=A0ABM0MMJ8_SACKO|nr:PREDICTED: uncharacterized protein DDB_G0286299-like [Saccoglossus kowalevskii]